MISLSQLAQEKVWLDKRMYDLAEKKYYEKLAKYKKGTSLPRIEGKSERRNEASDEECFVGLEKDEAGKIKLQEKIWLNKHLYDSAEKEYYEKLEKSRLISLHKDHEVQELNAVEKTEKQLFEVTGKESGGNVGIDVKYNLNNKENFLLEKQVSKNGLTVNDTKQQAVENSTSVVIIQNSANQSILSPNHCERKINGDINSARVEADLINEENKSSNKPNENKEPESQELKLRLFDDNIQSEQVEVNSLTNQREPREVQESIKQLKSKSIEQSHSDVIKEKRKPIEEKKSQDNSVKLQKGVQNLHKKSNVNYSPPKNKSTNVNTIPTFPKMPTNMNGLSSQTNCKGGEIDKNLPSIQKYEIGVKVNDPPVVKNSVPLTNTDDTQTKKETKKNKKNKKRHRDEKGVSQNANSWNSLAGEVAKARQHIKNSLQCIDDIASITSSNVVIEVNNRINTLEKENSEMKRKVRELTDLLSKFEQRLANIEKSNRSVDVTCSKPGVSVNISAQSSKQQYDDEDDGVDLFASDSEEESVEAAKVKEQRLADYVAKKSKKPAIIAKSSIVLDVKPWDDTTDMKLMEKEVRKISTDGLLWGASQLVPLAYGIHKLQISCVIEDEKVSVDWLQETIETIEDFVQSVDIAAFNKI